MTSDKIGKGNKGVIIGIWIFTVVVYALVLYLHSPGVSKPEAAPEFTKSLPLFHAILNGTCFCLLIFSLVAIKNGKVAMHQRLNTVAMILSVVFLLSYVLYHMTNGDTIYGGAYAGLYYFILFSHIGLAGLSLPGILFAFYRGLIGDIAKHKKIVRSIYPIWLYVSLTGVLVYVFLKPYY
ncbi:MAG: putative membrane protein [Glaciecola sp.]|jgi:putative membrane protein